MWHDRTDNENKLTKVLALNVCGAMLILLHLIIDERTNFPKNNSVLILMQLYLTNKRIFSIKGIIKLVARAK